MKQSKKTTILITVASLLSASVLLSSSAYAQDAETPETAEQVNTATGLKPAQPIDNTKDSKKDDKKKKKKKGDKDDEGDEQNSTVNSVPLATPNGAEVAVPKTANPAASIPVPSSDDAEANATSDATAQTDSSVATDNSTTTSSQANSQPANDAATEEENEDELIMMPGIGGDAHAGHDHANAKAQENQSDDNKDDSVVVAAKAANDKTDGDLETPDVVVTGTRLERKIEDAPVRTQLIKKEQLEQRKARNLYEALSYTSGVRVETNCQNCGFSQLRLNGLSGSYTQVLIDGLPSYSGLAGVYGLEQLPTEMIDRLEIVKGGGSALYGPSAVAGVVNLITKIPKENYATFVTSLDLVKLKVPDIRVTADAGIVSSNGKVGGHIFVSARRRNEVDFNGDNFSEMTRLRQLAGGGDLFIKPIDDAQLKLSFHVIREFRRGGDSIDKPPHAVDIAEQLNTDRWQGELRWHQKINDLIDYSLGYIFAYTGRKSYYGGGGKDGFPDLKAGDTVTQAQADQIDAMKSALGAYGRTFNPMHVADAHINFNYNALGPQVVTLGTQFTYDKIDDEYVGLDHTTKSEAHDIGVYLQHDWIFADWGESVLGLRLDKHSNLEMPIVSPRAALKFQPIDWLQLRTAFAMGFRAPQAFDEDLHVEQVGGVQKVIANQKGLKPERSLTIAQQINTDFHLPYGNVLEVGINGYYTRLQDAFDVEQNPGQAPNSPVIFETRINRGTTHVFGAELEGAFRSKLYAIRAGWTFEHARNNEPDGDIKDSPVLEYVGNPKGACVKKTSKDWQTCKDVYRILRTPNNYGYLDAVFKWKGLQAQAGLTLTGPMLVPHTVEAGIDFVSESPWFAVVDANVSYAVPVLGSFLVEPFLGIRNIFDQVQSDYDLGADRDSAYIYGPEQPRTIYFGVKGTL